MYLTMHETKTVSLPPSGLGAMYDQDERTGRPIIDTDSLMNPVACQSG